MLGIFALGREASNTPRDLGTRWPVKLRVTYKVCLDGKGT